MSRLASVVGVAIGFLVLACAGRERTGPPPPIRDSVLVVPPAPIDAAPVRDPWASGGAPDAAGADPLAVPDEAAARAIADTACPAVTAPFFFRVEKKGKASYLFGTRHLGVGVAKLPREVTDALVAARLAVFETAPDDRSGTAPAPGAPLPEQLGATAWARYVELVGEPLADQLADQAAPTALLILMMLYEDKTAALDDELQQLAAERRVPVQGLETDAFQDQVIAKWLDLRALRAAIQVTDDRAELRQTTIDDLTEYCTGADHEPGLDAKERADLLAGGYSEAELTAYMEDLLYARNRTWIPALVKLFAKGPVFVAVGADHLIGDRGLVALLRGKGYKVSRVTPAPRAPM